MKVEIGDVEGAELGALSGEDAVEHEFDKFKGGGFGSNITWVADVVARYGDSCAIRVVLLGPDLAYYIAVADFSEPVGWNVGEDDDAPRFAPEHPDESIHCGHHAWFARWKKGAVQKYGPSFWERACPNGHSPSARWRFE